MLKQTIKNIRSLTVSAVGATDGDTTALLGLMAGKVDKYKKVGEGGTAIAAIPSPLNKKIIIVGDKDPSGRMSTIMTIPHVKPASKLPELTADILGKFDSDYVGTIKCDYVKLKFDTNK